MKKVYLTPSSLICLVKTSINQVKPLLNMNYLNINIQSQ